MTLRASRDTIVLAALLLMVLCLLFVFLRTEREREAKPVPDQPIREEAGSGIGTNANNAAQQTPAYFDASATSTDTATLPQPAVGEPTSPPKSDGTARESHPYLATVTPSKATIGTPLTLRGENLAGFEGSLDAWIEFPDGRTAFLPAHGTSAYPKTDTITVLLTEYVCSIDTTYSGLTCPTEYRLEPGTYMLYTMPWGVKSNALPLTIDGPACAGLPIHLCNQTPECHAVYGPSSCTGDTCTADLAYRGCESMTPYAVDYAGRNMGRILRRFPALPYPPTYIEDYAWPPYLLLGGNYGAYACEPEVTTTIAGMPANTEEKLIGTRTYCITATEDGAAGSLYKTYTYTTETGAGFAKLWFTLRFSACGAYDDLERQACMEEREAFDIDLIVHDLLEQVLVADGSQT